MDRGFLTLTAWLAAGAFTITLLVTSPGRVDAHDQVAMHDQAMAQAHAVPAQSRVYYRRCADARATGVAPIYVGQPGYRSGLDRDNDGVACEPYPYPNSYPYPD